MAGLANNNNPFQSQVRIGPNYIQLVPGPPGPPGTIALTGSGLVHVTSGSVDNAAYLGAAGGIPIVNSGGTDTAWLAIGTAGQVLTVVGGAPTWAAAPSGVTWANDLSTSSNTNQYVSSISGANGTGTTATLGTSGNAFALIGSTTSSQSNTSLVAGTASGNNPGGTAVVRGGSGTTSGGVGTTGGQTQIVGGVGGASTGSNANSNGGLLFLAGGAPGTGGSGAAGVYGDVALATSVTAAFVTSKAAGPGFGIGSTPGTDPTITRGTGVPATTQTNGSLFLRTDGTSGSNALYAREGGAWYAIGGTTTTSATLTFEGQAFQLAAAGSGNGAILWPVGQATPSIGQVILATDVTPANIAITAQSAQPGAATHLTGGNLVLTSGTGASANGTPGNVIVNAPSPTGSGQYGGLVVQSGGTTGIWIGHYTAAGSFWQINFGANARSPSGNNFSFLLDDAGQDTQLNGVNSVRIRVNASIDQIDCNSSGIQLFGNNTYALGGGSNMLGITQTSTVPTSAPTNGIIAWANTGSPGSLGLFATGVQFHRLGGAITVSQDAPTSDVATVGMSVVAQSAYGSAVTNVNGGALTVSGGKSTNGTLGAAIQLGGAVNSGSVQGTIGAPTGQTWAWASTTVTTTTGTVTLSSSQYNTPIIQVSATLTGNLNITFPNQVGFWIVDTTKLILSGHTFTLQSGTATFAASANSVYLVITYGGNTLAVSGG